MNYWSGRIQDNNTSKCLFEEQDTIINVAI